jgi:WD40 repeat protein
LYHRPTRIRTPLILWLAALILLLSPALSGTANAAAPTLLARWGDGALTDGGVAVAPNGRVAAVATSIGVRLHNPTTHALLRTLSTPFAVEGVAFAPDSRILAVGLRGGTVELWRVADWQRLRRLTVEYSGPNRLLFTPDSRLLLVLSYSGAYLWRVSDGHVVAVPDLEDAAYSPGSLAFAPDGQTYAVSSFRSLNCTIQIRRWPNGALLRTFPVPASSACFDDLIFSPDGKILAGGGWTGIGLWRVEDGALLRTLPYDDIDVRDLQFAPDGQTLLVAYNIGERDPGFGYATYLQLWGMADGRALATWEGEWLRNPAFTPDGYTLLVSHKRGHVAALSLPDGTELPHFSALPAPLMRFALAPDGGTLAVSQGAGGVRLRRVADGRVLRTLGADLPPAELLTYAPNGQTLAVSTGGTVRLWRVADGRLLWTRATRIDTITGLVFTPGNNLVLAGFSQTEQEDRLYNPAQVWRASDGALVRTLGTNPAYTVAGAASSGLLAVSSSRTTDDRERPAIEIWRTTDWYLSRILTETWGAPALAPDGRQLATVDSEDAGLQLWNLPAGGRPRTLIPGQGTLGLSGPVAAAFAPDGQTLAVGDANSSLQIVRASDGMVLADLPGHAADIAQVAFSANGRLLVSAAWDGTLRIWRVR